MSFNIEEIAQLGQEIGRINGVDAVILFGSYAREDFDEGSDVDLLVVFRDKSSLEGGWRQTTEVTARKPIFVQLVTMTVDELKSSSLLSVVLREGKTLYSTQAFNLQRLASFKPYALLTYDLTSLTSHSKVKFIQNLQGRKSGKYTYKGLLKEQGGFKVGRNCLMIPLESVAPLTNFLEKEGINYFIRYVWRR